MDMFAAIKKEAMYCGFFCDQKKIRQLQQGYETSCLKSAVAPSPFDLDSASIDEMPLAQVKYPTSQAARTE